MELPNAKELADFFTSEMAGKSASERMIWYFTQFWVEVAEQAGYAYPAQFPEGSDLAAAHNAAHYQLLDDVARLTK